VPYRIAKDLRTRVEVGDVDAVLDGNLDPFIRGYLIMRRQGGAAGAAEGSPEAGPGFLSPGFPCPRVSQPPQFIGLRFWDLATLPNKLFVS
jgi:hypothetical protein